MTVAEAIKNVPPDEMIAGMMRRANGTVRIFYECLGEVGAEDWTRCAAHFGWLGLEVEAAKTDVMRSDG